MAGEVAVPNLGHDPRANYNHSMTQTPYFMPHFTQNSPSRFGQLPVPRFNHGKATAVPGSDWNHHANKVQAPPLSSFNSGGGGPHSPGSIGMPWGNNQAHNL